MSLSKELIQYTEYIASHIKNVEKAYNEYGKIICHTLMMTEEEKRILEENIKTHDNSKCFESEFYGYQQYYYPAPGATVSESEYKKAWLHHIHNNPHHPEYWILVGDTGEKDEILDMPIPYIAEMLLDWIAMSYQHNDKVYLYYEKEGHKKKFSECTRTMVERCMAVLKEYDKMMEEPK